MAVHEDVLTIRKAGAAEPGVVNGLNTETLNNLRGMLKEHPEGGRATFFSNSQWQEGARILTRISGFKIDGEMQHQNDRQFILQTDGPAELSGKNTAPGPVEQLMHALGSCIASTANANAALSGVKLDRLEVALESDLDLHGFFALDPQVRPGITELRAKITIAGDADEKTLREIAMRGCEFSPVRDSVEGRVALKPEVVVAH